MRLRLPTPQPTELVWDLLSRVARFNGIATVHDLCTHVLGSIPACRYFISVKNLVATTSVLYGIESSRAIQRHTLIPFRNAFKRHHAASNGLFGLDFGHTTQDVAKEQASSVRFCPNCLSEDIDWHGYSFFRRHHQLSAITRCQKHNEWLSETYRSLSPTLPSDKSFLERKHVQLSGFGDSQLALRFADLAEDLLDLKAPISSIKMGRQMRLHLGVKSSRDKFSSAGSTVRNLLKARSRKDIEWAHQTLNNLKHIRSSDPLLELEKSLRGEVFFTTPMLITLLLITATNEEAQTLLVSAIPASSQSQKKVAA